MWKQLLTPMGDSLGLSCLVAILPILTVLVVLGVLRRPGWLAAAAGLTVGFVVAVCVWQMPADLAVDAITNGAVFALWPVMGIVLAALLLYNIAERSGRFDVFQAWVVANIPNDRRVMVIVVGFCFGSLLEGVAGFGAPVAITSALLIRLGFPALDAVVMVLICNTAPVAFGALGTPITVLATVTGLPVTALAAMVGRQLPVMALLLPFYVTGAYGGLRSIKALWPVLFVAGGSFGATQFVSSNYLDYGLTDVLSALGSLVATILFLRVWRPAPDEAFAIAPQAVTDRPGPSIPTWQGLFPWVAAAAVVMAWTWWKVPLNGQDKFPWPGLHNAVAMTLYAGKPYAAEYTFQPLGTGSAIFVAAIITAVVFGQSWGDFVASVKTTLRQLWQAIITVMLIVGLAYLLNYSGISYTLGQGVASTGALFVLLSPFLGWLAVMLSGSDTSGNALFGNLQVVAARQLHLSDVLFAATNSSAGVTGKPVALQNIVTGTAATEMRGREAEVFARAFPHSIVLALFLDLVVLVQQYLIPWVIPVVGGAGAP